MGGSCGRRPQLPAPARLAALPPPVWSGPGLCACLTLGAGSDTADREGTEPIVAPAPPPTAASIPRGDGHPALQLHPAACRSLSQHFENLGLGPHGRSTLSRMSPSGASARWGLDVPRV